ncbi:hypothetical protein OROHE_026211 [Orobanche hederae]
MDNDFSDWWTNNSPAIGSNPDSQSPTFSPSPPPQSPTHPPIRTPTPNRPQGFYPYTPGYFHQFSQAIGYQPAFSLAFSPNTFNFNYSDGAEWMRRGDGSITQVNRIIARSGIICIAVFLFIVIVILVGVTRLSPNH